MWWFLFQEAALAPDDSVSTSTKSALIIFISGERKPSPIELRYHHSPRQRKNKEQGSDFNPEDEAIWACVRTGASEITHSQWDWFWSFLVENKLKLWIKNCLT